MTITENTSPLQDTLLGRRTMLTALVGSLVGTAVIGAPLYFGLSNNVWWVAMASVPALVVGGGYLAWTAREPEPLYGSTLSFFYFVIAAIVLFVGTWVGSFPDPMPGLATGDSTFYFVWPLMMLASGVVGSIVGGRMVAHRGHRA